MTLLKVLILSLTFCELIVDLDAQKCRDGLYRSASGCVLCTNCEENTGSVAIKKCTKDTDTKCECREGFAPFDDDSSTCECAAGRGIKGNECLACEEGYFNNMPNSKCKKWKNCGSAGVKVPGTSKSDVTCNPFNGKTPASTRSVPRTLTTLRPQEGATTQKTITTTLQKLTSTYKVMPNAPSNTGSAIGMALVIFGIAGLLVLTVLTCKMHITPYWKKKTTGQKMNSSCRKPIEEIGDVSESSAKLNPGEP